MCFRSKPISVSKLAAANVPAVLIFVRNSKKQLFGGTIVFMRRPRLRSAMAPKTTTTSAMPGTFQVTLLSCRKTGRVLFLEAGKDFVDLLLSFLLLPVGTILHILSTGPVKGKHLGGISSIFESVKNLQSSFFNVDKQTLVEPRPAAVGTCVSTGLLQMANTPNPSYEIDLPKVYYRCNSNACTSLSSKSGSRCEKCSKNYGYVYTVGTTMTVLPEDLEELEAAIEDRLKAPVEEASSSTGQGFVKESITYIVTDSLEIMPSTTIRSIKVLNKLKVATLSDLESSDIKVSIAQVLQLLQSALTSTSCLNDVFGKK